MPNVKRVLGWFLILLLLVAPISAARAAEDVFTVSGVKVDVKAENAVAAREKAFVEAQVAAFRALAEQLRGEAQMAGYTPPPLTVIAPMIQDFEITNERLSAVQYIGTYTFRFDGGAVRNHFHVPIQQSASPYGDDVYAQDDMTQPVMGGADGAAAGPVLVLPFYKMGAYTVLWQDPNPWMQAWSRQNHLGGPVPAVAPIGDIPDVADIGDNEALTYNTVNLVGMLSRYGASEAVILIATPGPVDSAGVPTDLQVMMYRTDHAVPEFSQLVTVMPDMNSTADGLYDKAVRQVKVAMQGGWRARPPVIPPAVVASQSAYPTLPATAIGMGPVQSVGLRVSFATMQQWIETRQALRRVQGLSDMKVKSVTPREAQVELQFSGDENRLRMMMAQADMVLGPRQGSGYSGGGVYEVYLRKYAPSIQ